MLIHFLKKKTDKDNPSLRIRLSLKIEILKGISNFIHWEVCNTQIHTNIHIHTYISMYIKNYIWAASHRYEDVWDSLSKYIELYEHISIVLSDNWFVSKHLSIHFSCSFTIMRTFGCHQINNTQMNRKYISFVFSGQIIRVTQEPNDVFDKVKSPI